MLGFAVLIKGRLGGFDSSRALGVVSGDAALILSGVISFFRGPGVGVSMKAPVTLGVLSAVWTTGEGDRDDLEQYVSKCYEL